MGDSPALVNSKLPVKSAGWSPLAAAERQVMDAVERFFIGMAIVGFFGLFLTVGLSILSQLN